ncbi:MAG: hypothetical protein EZS28_032733 [Streblomastix strix]|uniref:Uncharacterized protein n=1 Tax=Streblomastix strix TaxID=222440 RepID=A0A5J4UMJ3_9EUKA|nr:MAG: hypothetical protein EZS28_032733 [Streblomastix strix]
MLASKEKKQIIGLNTQIQQTPSENSMAKLELIKHGSCFQVLSILASHWTEARSLGEGIVHNPLVMLLFPPEANLLRNSLP